MSFSSSHQFAVDSNGCTPVQPQPNHTWKTTLFGKTFFFNPRPRNPLPISRFVVMSFFYRRLCHSILELSFCSRTVLLFTFFLYFVARVCFFFFFVCTFTHCLSLFLFSIMLYALLEKQTNKKLPEKQFYSMNIKPRLEDPINLFHYLQHLCFFMITASRRACVFACVSFYYRPPIRKCASWYC